MFDELRIFLQNITTPENTQNIINACEILSQAGYISHDSEIDTVLSNIKSSDSNKVLQDLYAVTEDFLLDAVNTYGIIVTEETNIQILTKILEGLLILEDYGDPETLVNYLNQEISSEEILCEVLGEVTSLYTEHFLPHIQSVDVELIDNSKRYMEERLEESEAKDLTLQRDRFKKFRAIYNDSFAEHALREGCTLAMPLDTLILNFNEQLSLLENNPEKLAYEILSLYLISENDNTNIMGLVGEILEDYAKDINTVTKARDFLTKALSRVFA